MRNLSEPVRNSPHDIDNGYCLSEGLVKGCVLKQNIKKDDVITYDDVKLPPNRLADKLRAEQYKQFRGETWLEEFLLGREIEQSVSYQSVS